MVYLIEFNVAVRLLLRKPPAPRFRYSLFEANNAGKPASGFERRPITWECEFGVSEGIPLPESYVLLAAAQ
jgi:hypothetical protein